MLENIQYKFKKFIRKKNSLRNTVVISTIISLFIGLFTNNADITIFLLIIIISPFFALYFFYCLMIYIEDTARNLAQHL